MNFIKIEVIAEIGQAHEGSLGIAHSYIDALVDAGIKVIKFQTHIAEAESSAHEPFRINFSYEDNSRYDYWKRMEFSEEEWKGLKSHCDRLGVEFLSSPFSIQAVELLERLDVKRYKIGSGEITNRLLLKRVAETKKPIILSTGMSNFSELSSAIDLIKEYHNDISILQCTTAYPTSPKQWGFNMIEELKNKFNLPVGFSDHSGEIYACLFAASRGASILEFHCVFDKLMFGPDSKASLNINEIKILTKGINQLNVANQNPVDKENLEGFEELKNIFEKSLAVNRDIKKGEVLKVDDLETKKPANMGIASSNFEEVIGRKLNRSLTKWDFLNYEDLEK